MSATDLAAVIWDEVQAIRGAMTAGDPERARVIAQLVSVGLRAVEASTLLPRLEALEAAIGEPGSVLAWPGK
ncbi:MAG: hypothetical protein MUF10_00285 [Thermoanaerobaculaceae bacterium]|nr:hypothetical protein [Thermoanaerobaculaceae bacterium]